MIGALQGLKSGQILEGMKMKISYDPKYDVLYLKFTGGYGS